MNRSNSGWRRGLAVAIASLGCAHAAFAQQYPTRPVRIVISFTAGGPTDTVARLVAQRLTEAMGAQFIVDNRPGGGGTIGPMIAARAAADGYTLFLGGITSLSMAPHMNKKLPYDPFKDFTPISKLTIQPLLLTVHPSLPVKTVKDLIALARARPGQLDYASSGRGGTGHLTGELFKQATKTDIVHIPYKSAGPALTDLAAGQVQMMFGTLLSTVPLIRNNRLRPIAVTGRQRSVALPEVPTFDESGLPKFESVSWNSLVAPAGTPNEIIVRLNREVVKMLSDKSLLARLSGDGVVAVSSSPEELGAYIKSESEKWGKVIRDAGIEPN